MESAENHRGAAITLWAWLRWAPIAGVAACGWVQRAPVLSVLDVDTERQQARLRTLAVTVRTIRSTHKKSVTEEIGHAFPSGLSDELAEVCDVTANALGQTATRRDSGPNEPGSIVRPYGVQSSDPPTNDSRGHPSSNVQDPRQTAQRGLAPR
jgi:hypothetical protein